tara:strand:+ start:292 stop:393 length:102 start_codon:yes stop_codon:yes gene_type:complete
MQKVKEYLNNDPMILGVVIGYVLYEIFIYVAML